MSDVSLNDWLLEASTPSIRYLSLHRLLGRPRTDPGVRAAWDEMHRSGPIPAILSGQTERGHWAGERGYYTPKYVSTHWSMLLLCELAADGGDPRLQRGAEFMLAATQQELAEELQRGRYGLSCFWGNLLRYTLHCGCAADPRLGRIVDYLVHDAQVGSWRCSHNDGLRCAWGAARALWGLAALPAEQRSPSVQTAVQQGTGFLLEEYSLVQADYPCPRGKVHPLWFRLNFPLFYQVDVLFVLRVLAELGGLDHPEAQPALAWLEGRRQKNGRWRGSSPFRSRTWSELGDREETDRWVSLQAALLLTHG